MQNLDPNYLCSYDSINGKISLTLTNSISKIVFYDVSFTNSKSNYNLGWILGFRISTEYFLLKRLAIVAPVIPEPITAIFILLSPSSYVFLNTAYASKALCRPPLNDTILSGYGVLILNFQLFGTIKK